ncbi:MAG: nucleotidyltransferase domain-containing protein [Ignavibacteriae bacterium]|nr:nucleotidyltransferase domain-containing protein [Ignavibacteriota bacterium]
MSIDLKNPLTIDIQKRLHSCGVELVYLFGSHAEGTEHPLSDVDIGVVFSSPLSDENVSDMYNELYDIFTDVFPQHSVDIVLLQRAGLELCFDVISHGKILFEAKPGSRYDFIEYIQIMYADFRPHLDEFNKQVLERIG